MEQRISDLRFVSRSVSREGISQPGGMSEEAKRGSIPFVVSEKVGFEEFHDLLSRIGLWETGIKHGTWEIINTHQINHGNVPETRINFLGTRFNLTVLE